MNAHETLIRVPSPLALIIAIAVLPLVLKALMWLVDLLQRLWRYRRRNQPTFPVATTLLPLAHAPIKGADVRNEAGLHAGATHLLDLLNGRRAAVSSHEIIGDPALQSVSRGHAIWMGSCVNLSHDGNYGRTAIERIRLVDRNGDWAQLIARVHGASDWPARVIKRWFRRRKFRQLLLSNDYTLGGIGVARSEDGNVYVVLKLANR